MSGRSRMRGLRAHAMPMGPGRFFHLLVQCELGGAVRDPERGKQEQSGDRREQSLARRERGENRAAERPVDEEQDDGENFRDGSRPKEKNRQCADQIRDFFNGGILALIEPNCADIDGGQRQPGRSADNDSLFIDQKGECFA